MSIAIENIRDLSDDQKKDFYGTKYTVTYNVKCIKTAKEYEVVVTPSYHRGMNTTCPCCNTSIEFPSGASLNKRSGFNPWSNLPSLPRKSHVIKEINRVSMGLFTPEDHVEK